MRLISALKRKVIAEQVLGRSSSHSRGVFAADCRWRGFQPVTSPL